MLTPPKIDYSRARTRNVNARSIREGRSEMHPEPSHCTQSRGFGPSSRRRGWVEYGIHEGFPQKPFVIARTRSAGVTPRPADERVRSPVRSGEPEMTSRPDSRLGRK